MNLSLLSFSRMGGCAAVRARGRVCGPEYGGVGCDVARCHPRRSCHKRRWGRSTFHCSFQCCVYGSMTLCDPLRWPSKAKTGYAVFMVGEAETMSTDLSTRLSLLNLVLCYSYVGCVLPSILNRPRGH